MKDADLIRAVLACPLNSLEIFKVAIDDKISFLLLEEQGMLKAKNQASEVFEHFAAEGMKILPKQRGGARNGSGRKIDSNSARQRIKSIILEMLENAGKNGLHYSQIFASAYEITGISADKLRYNAYPIKGINRFNGIWKLEKFSG